MVVVLTVFDMKLFISVNRHADEMVFLAWSPRMANGDIVFLIGGKMVGSELQVHRFSQSPHPTHRKREEHQGSH